MNLEETKKTLNMYAATISKFKDVLWRLHKEEIHKAHKKSNELCGFCDDASGICEECKIDNYICSKMTENSLFVQLIDIFDLYKTSPFPISDANTEKKRTLKELKLKTRQILYNCRKNWRRLRRNFGGK